VKLEQWFRECCYESRRAARFSYSRIVKTCAAITKTIRRPMLGAILLCVDHDKDKVAVYLPLLGAGEALVGASKAPERANASIAIFQVPASGFSILNQFPWIVWSLTITE
jgi:hypothetical protein